MLGTAATTLVGGFFLKPTDRSAPYTAYFSQLNARLQQHGLAHPMMVLDAQHVRHNVNHITAIATRPIRLVVKSLPSIPLLKNIANQVGTHRFMVFHAPFMRQLLTAFPQGDFLLGKPMPIQAAAHFYSAYKRVHVGAEAGANPITQVQWLIDTKARLVEYLALARSLDQRLNINLEIDVGLHRGGVNSEAQLGELLRMIEQHPDHLKFSGFMGYDAHMGAVPTLIESVEAAYATMAARYRHFIQVVKFQYAALWSHELCFNGAGSLTFALHDDNSPLTEMSIGSAFVKPSDFDLTTLHALKPACFIATPVLKSMAGLNLPAPALLSKVVGLYDVNARHTFFVYGGKWMATPYAPQGLQPNTFYGESSNQEMYNASNSLGLKVNDAIFFRPTQSEKVFLEFGDLYVFDADHMERYAVFNTQP